MIRFYADALDGNVPNARLMAIKAVREARVLLAEVDTTLVLARDQVDKLAAEGEGFLVGETELDAVAQRVPPILTSGALVWHYDNDTGEAPIEEPPAETPRPAPSYEAGMIACILMAVVDGNIGGAISAAQSIGRTLAEEPAKGDPFWNEVLKCLLDSFPVKGDGVHEDVQALAARLHAGGFE